MNSTSGPGLNTGQSDMDVTSVCLTDESLEDKALTDDELLDILVSKHRFQDHGKVIHVAIIDFLTQFTTFKKLELCAKSFQAPRKTLSVAHPTFYGDRFEKWMRKNVFGDD